VQPDTKWLPLSAALRAEPALLLARPGRE